MQHTINEIKELMAKIQELQDSKENIYIDDLDIDQEEIYNDFLDECYEKITICSIEFYASDILKSCDPIAYKCGLNDYFADVDIKNFSEYQDKNEEIDQEIDDIKEDIKSIIDNL